MRGRGNCIASPKVQHKANVNVVNQHVICNVIVVRHHVQAKDVVAVKEQSVGLQGNGCKASPVGYDVIFNSGLTADVGDVNIISRRSG